MTLELCADSIDGARMAAKYGLKRIELCTSLDVGGLTPSFGMISQCAEIKEIETHVLIRPRSGDFNYNNTEIALMKMDIIACKKAGVRGVVFGALNNDLTVSDANIDLINTAKNLGLKCTFHRAFDLSVDLEGSMEKLISLGFDRLLTSGKCTKAIEGIDLISELQKEYGYQIQIMAGSGVSIDNAKIFQNANIQHLHFTARIPSSNSTKLGMGTLFKVDENKIKSISNLFN